MKTTTLFFGLTALFSASFVVAKPTGTVEPRCEECDEACPKDWFYYHPKQCCLQNGGPPKVSNPPSGKGCPSNWYWHDEKSCCTPKTKPSTPTPSPTCGSTTYPWWNPDHQCCEHPSNPPPSQPSANVKLYKKSTSTKKTHVKKALPSRDTNPCPAPLEFCPILGAAADQFECVDPALDVKACGGCPTTGKGQDCTAIPGALGVACDSDPSTAVSVCKINSCQDGFVLSKDGKTCTAVLVSQ